LVLTHVVAKAVPTGTDPKLMTTVLMVVVCVLFPVVPTVLLFMGMSLGVVSVLTLGALMPKSKGTDLVRTTARVLEDQPHA
jgi:hypothetical protein